jgi:hypothetical protein
MMKPRHTTLFASLVVGMVVGLAPYGGPAAFAAPPAPAARPAAHPAQPAQPTISADAAAAVAQMGKTLQASAFSFAAHTIREYPDAQTGELLHVFHSFVVTVKRPDRLLVEGTGDDGARKLIYDGKTADLVLDGGKKYASIPSPNTIEGMLQEVVGKLGVDFPLADLLTSDPAKSVLNGVTGGRVIGTVPVNGVPCTHLFFTQTGVELELWIEQGEQAVPRRVVVTYRSVDGSPSFIAQLDDWKFDVHPADSDFAFTPPAGAVKVDLKPAAAGAHPAAHTTGGK